MSGEVNEIVTGVRAKFVQIKLNGSALSSYLIGSRSKASNWKQ